MATIYHPTEKKIKYKRDFVNSIFKYKRIDMPRKEIEESRELQSEILYQVEICEGLNCPVPFETIIEWIESNNVRKIQNEARRIKFAS